jgi:hypothetical protein
VRSCHVTYSFRIVAPANAGTHNHRTQLLRQAGAPARHSHEHLWLWVPAFAGTTG